MATTTTATHIRPRSLVLKSHAKNLSMSTLAAESASPSDPNDPPLADPGDVQLINYYKPALEGGVYTINIQQQIQVPAGPHPASTNNINTTPDNPGPQEFEVIAPRFSIGPNDVHSTYPPQGHADQPMILPHIIFNDPHIPWERSVKIAETFLDDDVMPWLAVMPFDINGSGTEQELRLTDTQLNGATAVYQPSDGSIVTQSTTCAVTMPLSQYLLLGSSVPSGGTTVHIPPFSTDLDWANMQNDATPVDVVFLSGSLFKGIFASTINSSAPSVSQYRYCAHVRNINTQGMAAAGVEDTGLFGVLHSLRTGPTDIAQNTAPRTQAVHLLNIEYIEQMSMPANGDLVALVSLYSWTYLCQPPLSVNFVDAMRNIGDQIKEQTSLLRYSDPTIASLSSAAGQSVFSGITDSTEATTIQTLMKERFTNAYALVRHRTAPGQTTVAFTRSPLVPVIVPRSPALPLASNNGQNYQILDQRVGIMDISYSSAFQYGKTLGSADTGFVAALLRIRNDVHTAGAANADAAIADPVVPATTKENVVKNLPTAVKRLTRLSQGSIDSGTPSLRDRWSKARQSIELSTRTPNDDRWQARYVEGVKKRMKQLASAAPVKTTSNNVAENTRSRVLVKKLAATPATNASAADSAPFNGLVPPVSTDWAYLFNWIMDKFFLDKIPVHYLITDPAHLPPESIRFFHIDPTWLDCLIDGVLSVANHLATDDDVIRQSIKAEINKYLSTPIGSGSTAHLPQIPLYGFFLRSAVVKVFPDLQVSIPYPNGSGSNLAPILVQRRMASDILMVLLDRLPDSGQISRIRFTQPVHQQCFSAGDSLDANTIEFLFRKVYRTTASQAAASDALHEFGEPHSFTVQDPSRIAYSWTSRCLNFATIEQELFNSSNGLVAEMPSEWGPPVQALLTSSMTAIQLNDTIKYLEILPPESLGNTQPVPRQIYVGETSATPAVASSLQDTSAKRLAAATPNSSQTMSKLAAKPQTLKPNTGVSSINQQLPKPLPSSSAKILSRSLGMTPDQLNTLTGSKAISKVASTNTGSAASTGATTNAFGVLPTDSLNGGNPRGFPPPVHQVSRFEYAIYPSTFVYTRSFPPSLPRFVTTTNAYPPDIVFSINLGLPNIPPNQSHFLHEIDFRIPIGDPSLRKDLNTDIIGGVGLVPVNSSAGVSARMLSNQRWVVHMDVQATYLNLRVIPRTLNLSVAVAQCTTLSFKLSEVEIAGKDGKSITTGISPVFVNIGITEIYGFYTDATRTQWVNQGSAQQVITLQRK